MLHQPFLTLTKATVAAIGLLSPNPREYAVQLILFSGSCKKEKSEEHTQLIKMILRTCNRQSKQGNSKYRTVCIASDGKAKHGDALVILTMTSELSFNSPIYAQLRPLEFLNLLQVVGPDDIAADKDPKHIIKHQQNTLMRKQGIEVLRFCFTLSILSIHLESSSISPPQQ